MLPLDMIKNIFNNQKVIYLQQGGVYIPSDLNMIEKETQRLMHKNPVNLFSLNIIIFDI